jgi:hypothetical protein
MKQLDLLDSLKPPRGGIDKQEFALILDAEGNFKQYAHGTYEEIEYYCEQNNCWVDKYLNYVAPHVVRQGFDYIGSGPGHYELQRGFNYDTSEKVVDDSF